MPEPRDILKQYWGYDSFRPGQEQIVCSVLEGHDVLALLPTGGGKSICYQVPALCMEGICLVISPLMALMYDQVRNLVERGISAKAITSAMSIREIDHALNDAVRGRIKFLFVAPERLHSALFSERFKSMNVGLIAVDEAHCISQWGYDFRPAYLRIAEIRTEKKNVPVLALTASATGRVVDDICERLAFRNGVIHRNSFARPNLGYIILSEENKEQKLLSMISRLKGSGVVYAGTRQRVKETSLLLLQNKVSSTYYHAGLSARERDKAYRSWLSNEHRVICATNAFGMGIDKPDVRFVIHLDVPPNPESYFQEAGRAGRDGQQAFAVLLWNQADVERLRGQLELKYPSREYTEKVYQALCNYYQIAIGSGQDTSHVFDIVDFAQVSGLKAIELIHALNILEQSGYISQSDVAWQPSRLHFPGSAHDVYNFRVTHPSLDTFIHTLLRMYGGLFEHYVNIREEDLAKAMTWNKEQVETSLRFMHQHLIADYTPRTEFPRITFLFARSQGKHLLLSDELIRIRKEIDTERTEAMISLLERRICRSEQLLAYFGEKDAPSCGCCDVCREEKRRLEGNQRSEKLEQALTVLLKRESLTIDELVSRMAGFTQHEIADLVRWKLDEGQLILDNTGKMRCKG